MKNKYYITLMVRDKNIPGVVLHITYRLKEETIKDAVEASKFIESKIMAKFNYLPHSQYLNTKPFTGYSHEDYPKVNLSSKSDTITTLISHPDESQKQLKIQLKDRK